MNLKAFRFVTIGAFVLLLAHHGFAQTRDDEDAWRFSLEGSWRYGPVDGYVQIPSGGEPGTTSRNRPKLSEMGIHNASVFDVEARVDWHSEEFYLGAQIIRLSGDNTLDSGLVSHGDTFPAGTSVSSDVQLDWYRAGYRHHFALLEDRSLIVSPGVGVAVLDFSYNLDASGAGPSANRSFVHVTPQISLDTEWKPIREWPVSLELKLSGSPYFGDSVPGIFDEELLAKYRAIDNSKLALEALVGIAFEQITFHDNQTVQNRIDADFGPMLVLGLRLDF